MRKLQLEIQPAGAPGEHLGVDRERGIVFGAQVMRAGDCKGHDCYVDQTTLAAVVAAGNKAQSGVKARFEHPAMCSPTLGTYLGRQKNFRLDGDVVRADLHLYEKADAARRAHVLDMAEDNPDMIGQSVVVYANFEDGQDERFKTADGKKKEVMRVTHLLAVDVVDEGAATDGMFAAPVADVELEARTLADLKRALERPGFVERALQFLKLRQADAGAEIEEGASPDDGGAEQEEAMGDLTLKDLREKHPEVAKEYAAELSAAHAEALSAAEAKGVAQERARVAKLVARAKAHHFAPTAAHPHGFVAHALKEGLSYEACLEGLMDLDVKADALSLLEEGSAAIPVGSAEIPAQLTPAQVADANLIAYAAEYKKQKGGA